MKILKRGSRGAPVKNLQQQLFNINMYNSAIDGIFGRGTERAVKAFQTQAGLLVDGIVGPQTMRAIEMFAASQKPNKPAIEITPESKPAPKGLVERFDQFAKVMKSPVIYGPGRGLFVDGEWVVSWGPTKLNSKTWPIKPGHKRGPSLHCSSLTNFLLGYLLNYNDKWTHAGNRPLLQQLCTVDSGLHDQPRGGGAKFRGYGEFMQRLASDGDTLERVNLRVRRSDRYMDAIELWDRRAELATFNFFSQGSKKNGRWNLDHHTGVFVYHHDKKTMYRMAADGYRSKKSPRWYSATPVSYKKISKKWCQEDDRVYQIFKLEVDTIEGHWTNENEPVNIITEK